MASPSGTGGTAEPRQQGRQPAQDHPVVSPADTPDPGSFGGHPYTPDERKLGYGTDHDPRDPVVSPADTIRRTVGDMRHTHGLLNSMDPECSPMQRCLRCELENGLAALLAVGERDRRQIARLTEALETLLNYARRTDIQDALVQGGVDVRAVLAGEEDAG